MNAHVTISEAKQRSSDLETAAYDVLMRAEIMLTLADRYWANIADVPLLRHTAGSLYDEMSYMMHEVHKAAITMHKAAS